MLDLRSTLGKYQLIHSRAAQIKVIVMLWVDYILQYLIYVRVMALIFKMLSFYLLFQHFHHH